MIPPKIWDLMYGFIKVNNPKPDSSRTIPSPCFSGKYVVTLSENHLVKTSQTNFISIAIRIIRTSLLEEDRDIRPDTFIPAY